MKGLTQTPLGKVLEEKPTTKQCQMCAKDFTLQNPFLALYVHYCPACTEVREREDAERRKAEEEARRVSRWQEICPLDYRETDPLRLPRPNMLPKVLEWSYGPRGLILHGRTGLGKSRCAWLLMKRENDSGRKIKVADYGFTLKYGALFSESAAAAGEWIDALSGAHLLLLDDAFKAKMTDSAEQALYTVIARRCESQLPTVTTLNDTKETLAQRLSEDRADALIRRLVEYSTTIAFV